MTHTELYFMVQNYALFVTVGLLIVTVLIHAVFALLEKWRGEKKNDPAD